MSVNTDGGTTTSLNNTPQAKDDYYSASEDQVLYFCVMENDLGGNAKVLWSVDNTSDDGSGDLVARDVAGVSECSELGAKISLTSDGRIKYDTTLLDGLAAGQTVTDQFTYAIRLSNGTLSWATVTVALTGTNDEPVAVSDVASGSEDMVISGSVATNDSDVDAGAVLSFAVNGTAPAGFIMDEDGNWTLDAADPAYQHIAQGATEDVVVSYTVTDEHGASATATLTITVSGVNDAPETSDDAAGVAEDASISGSVAGNDGDVDDGAELTYALVDAAPEGLSFGADGNWSFDASSYDSLPEGEELVLTIPYTVTDQHGASDGATLTITITGTNDAPVAVADLATTGENELLTIDVLANDTDVDDGAVLTVTAASASPGQGTASVAANKVTFDPGTDFDHLAAGASEVVTVSYTIVDEHGASSSSTVEVTVTGTNDIPVAYADLSTVEEDEIVTGSVATNDSDADEGALLSYALDDPANAPAGLIFGSDGSWSFDASSYDSLPEGGQLILTIPYTVTDEHGASDGATLTITVTGTNDGPVASEDIATTGENNLLTVDVLANDTDADDSAVLTVTAASAPAGQGTASVVGNQVKFDPGADFDYLAVGESTAVVVSYSIEDEHGASSNSTLTITVTGTNDAPVAVADEASTDEDNSVLINALGNDDDPDISDTLTITAAVVAAGLGSVTIESGQLRYDPGSDYDGLAAGEIAEVTLSYTIADGHGGTDTASVTVTVTGVNDAPVAIGVTDATDEDTVYNGAVTGSDVDGDALTYALAAGESRPDGVTFNGDGTFSVAPLASDQGLDDGESRVVTFNIVANDGTVDSAPQAVTIAINGANDAPELTGAAAALPAGSEDNSYTVTQAQLLQGWTDVDVETLTATGLTASNGTVVQNGDGSYTITPAGNFNGPVTLNYFVSDGTASVAASLGYTLAPVNDAAAITGSAAGTVVEDAVPNTVGGNLDSTDVDGVNDSWNAVLVATASASGYGTYTIDESGNWVYSLDNGNAALDDLDDGETLSDSFTVTTADGTSQVVTITINGHTDFTYTPPPLSNAPDLNDFDDDHLGSVAPSLVIMSPPGPNGANTIEGSNGSDTIYAGNGSDAVYGHNGGDHIFGENGADMSLYGQRGDDFIYGGSGNDKIYGGSGNDTIYGNSNPDDGGAANDIIFGGSGRDTIYGQNGDDIINGGNGQDLLTGGLGADIFVYEKATDTGDFIFDFQQGSDKINLTAFGFDATAFVGALSGAGEVGAGQFGYMTSDNGGGTTVTTIYVDTDGIYGADMEITLVSNVSLTGSDFLI